MTALISVIPIVLLIVLMMGFKVSGYKSAVITLIVTILLALFAVPAMGILPEKFAGVSIVGITIWSVVEGFLKACFPIILIIICAIFSYNILCETKEIETIKTQFIQMTSDKGLLVLLLTWGLGGVLEGMAGFGTAVAIPAAILIGLGFKPMFSAVICLVANTVAVGFGAVGLPATTLANQVAARALRGGYVHHPAALADVLHHAVPHPDDDRPHEDCEEYLHRPVRGLFLYRCTVLLRPLHRPGDTRYPRFCGCHHRDAYL